MALKIGKFLLLSIWYVDIFRIRESKYKIRKHLLRLLINKRIKIITTYMQLKRTIFEYKVQYTLWRRITLTLNSIQLYVYIFHTLHTLRLYIPSLFYALSLSLSLSLLLSLNLLLASDKLYRHYQKTFNHIRTKKLWHFNFKYSRSFIPLTLETYCQLLYRITFSQISFPT